MFPKGCWGLHSHSYPRAAKKGRHAFGIHMVYRETFLLIHMLLLILMNWIHGGQPLRSRFICLQRRRVIERDQDLRCQSGPSVKDSVIFSGGDSSKNYGADQQRVQISDFHFNKFTTPATFACWKIRFETEVCTCSQFPTEEMQWTKKWSWLFSGRIKIFVVYSWYFNAEFWSTRCEDCFSIEQNHPFFPFHMNRSGGTKGPERGPFPSR